MRESLSRSLPLDQADGLRRLFAHARVQIVPVVSNPHIAFGGVLLERLCAALAEHGRHTLVVDAGERAGEPSELAQLDLADGVETLSRHVSYLAARGAPLRYVDAQGSSAPFLRAVLDAAPHADVLLVHASAPELCRLFARQRAAASFDFSEQTARPILLADDRPASVTHAYAAMKLLTQRAGLVVHDLLLGAASHSPRTERIAMQLATCADDFLGAALRGWAAVDPAADPGLPPAPALRRLVMQLLDAPGEPAGFAALREPRLRALHDGRNAGARPATLSGALN